MSNPFGKVALVTGASGGIGAAITRKLLDYGYNVHGTSTHVEAQQDRPSRLVMHTLDIRDDHAVIALVSDVIRRSGQIDVLVNNAGVGLAGALEETSIPEAKDLFDINFFGPLRATIAVLQHMRAARRGRIIFVSSVLGFLPAPFLGIYGASKYALEGYAETLDHEVRQFGVRSILVEPSFTATGFAQHQRVAAQHLAAYASVGARVLNRFAANTVRGARPEAVAEVVLEAASAESPKLRYPVGNSAKSMSRLRRFVPSRLFEKSFRQQFLLDT